MNKNIIPKGFPCRPFRALPSPNQPSRGLRPWLGYTAPSGLKACGLERDTRSKAKFHTPQGYTLCHKNRACSHTGTSPTLNS